MHNSHKYSSVLLVLLLQWKPFTGLPFEQPNAGAAPVGAPLPLAASLSSNITVRSANVSDDGLSLRSGLEGLSANLSSNNPSVRSAFEGAPGANLSNDGPSLRSALEVAGSANLSGPSVRSALESANFSSSLSFRSGLEGVDSAALPNNNPSVRSAFESIQSVNASADPTVGLQPQLFAGAADIAPRNAFNVNIQPVQTPLLVEPQSRSDFGSSINATVAIAPAFRSGLVDFTSNGSNIQERSFNASSNLGVAVRGADNGQTEVKNGFGVPDANSGNAANPFVPSFLKSFGLRRKRDENVGENVAQVNAPQLRSVPEVNGTSDVVARSSFEQLPLTNNNNAAPAAPQVSANYAPSGVNARSNLESLGNPNAAPQVGVVSVDVVDVRSQPQVPQILNPVGSSAVPYVKVFPLGTVN